MLRGEPRPGPARREWAARCRRPQHPPFPGEPGIPPLCHAPSDFSISPFGGVTSLEHRSLGRRPRPRAGHSWAEAALLPLLEAEGGLLLRPASPLKRLGAKPNVTCSLPVTV